MFTISVLLSDVLEAKKLDKSYEDAAVAEELAFWLLGTETPNGTIIGAQVLDHSGLIVSEFEY